MRRKYRAFNRLISSISVSWSWVIDCSPSLRARVHHRLPRLRGNHRRRTGIGDGTQRDDRADQPRQHPVYTPLSTTTFIGARCATPARLSPPRMIGSPAPTARPPMTAPRPTRTAADSQARHVPPHATSVAVPFPRQRPAESMVSRSGRLGTAAERAWQLCRTRARRHPRRDAGTRAKDQPSDDPVQRTVHQCRRDHLLTER